MLVHLVPCRLVVSNVSGVEGYEDYVLTGISGLSVGDEDYCAWRERLPMP